MRLLRLEAAFSLLVCAALVSCAKKEPPPPPPEPTAIPVPTVAPTPAPFKVTALDLGKSIGDDKKVKETTATFGRRDTIYLAVSTDGAAPKATLKVKWTFGAKGTPVNEESRDIAPTGPAVTEFHIAKPSGWPVGKYKVEVWADGNSSGTKEFEVGK